MKISELGDKWFSVYEICLRQYNVKEVAAIAKAYRPRKLYKYFSFTSNHWKDNAFNGALKFSFPSDFNDPLDSRWFLNYETIFRERFREINEEWTIERFGGKDFFGNCVNLNEEDLLFLRELFCVCCFSQTPHSNLMWGHYANKHKGFCLEYDLSVFPTELNIIMPVVYTREPFDASMIIDMRGIEDKYARLCPSLFKSTDWSYEKEWRLILPNKEYDVAPCESVQGAISGVYFGFDSYSSERNVLEEWAERNNIPTYQVERSYMSFELQSESIKEMRRNKTHTGLLI